MFPLLPGVMVVEGMAVFSLSSALLTLCCFEFSRCSGEASFISVAFFAFKHVFSGCGESSSVVSAVDWHEFESSGRLCNVWTSHVVSASSTAPMSFSDENERRLFIPLSPLVVLDFLPESSGFKVGLNIFGSSAIVLNVPAGSCPHCIMGNVDRQQCCVHGYIKRFEKQLSCKKYCSSGYCVLIKTPS